MQSFKGTTLWDRWRCIPYRQFTHRILLSLRQYKLKMLLCWRQRWFWWELSNMVYISIQEQSLLLCAFIWLYICYIYESNFVLAWLLLLVWWLDLERRCDYVIGWGDNNKILLLFYAVGDLVMLMSLRLSYLGEAVFLKFMLDIFINDNITVYIMRI